MYKIKINNIKSGGLETVPKQSVNLGVLSHSGYILSEFGISIAKGKFYATEHAVLVESYTSTKRAKENGGRNKT
ncbi:MAG: hypothetical protein LUD00_09190 [Prevotellaceae bacterium]|nr:hypothetical protein [Prevotellaceae bacterium]